MSASRLLLPVLVLSLFSQYQVGGAAPDLSKKYAMILSSILEGRVMDEGSAYAEAEGYVVTDKRNITLHDFGSGYAVEGTFRSPQAGRVTLNLMDESEDNIILHVDARYNWYTSKEVLVLNTHTVNGGWGQEEKPLTTNFDFTPNVRVTVRVEAEAGRFSIFCNGRYVDYYNHRLPVNEVKKIQLIYEDDNENPIGELESLAVIFPPRE